MFAAYYRRKDDLENYYKSSLTFLAYTNPADLDSEEKKQWSTKMGMAVLLGKNIFNITELVSTNFQANHPYSLTKRSSRVWLEQTLNGFMICFKP